MIFIATYNKVESKDLDSITKAFSTNSRIKSWKNPVKGIFLVEASEGTDCGSIGVSITSAVANVKTFVTELPSKNPYYYCTVD